MTLTMPRPGELAWQDRAACLGKDTSIFFPEGRGTGTKAGRAICAVCEVRSECLLYGLRENFGIWGGTSERERRQLRKGLAPKPRSKPRPTLRGPRVMFPAQPLRDALEALVPDYGSVRAMSHAARLACPELGNESIRSFLRGRTQHSVTLAWATKVCAALGRPDLPSQLWPEAREAAA